MILSLSLSLSQTGELIWETKFKYMIHDMSIISIPNSNDKTIWATVAEQNEFYIFDPLKYSIIRSVSLPDNMPCYTICTYNDFVFIGSQNTIFIYNCFGDFLGFNWQAHTGIIRNIFTNRDNSLIFTVANNIIYVWNIFFDMSGNSFSFKKVKKIVNHQGRITAIQLFSIPHLNSSGNYDTVEEIWSASYDYNVLVSNTKSYRPYYEFTLPESKELVRCFAKSHNFVFMGSSFYYPNSDVGQGTLYIYDFNDIFRLEKEGFVFVSDDDSVISSETPTPTISTPTTSTTDLRDIEYHIEEIETDIETHDTYRDD